MKAVICNVCHKAEPFLFEVRTIKRGIRSRKTHLCAKCMARISSNMAYGPKNIDIPLDPPEPPYVEASRPDPEATTSQLD